MAACATLLPGETKQVLVKLDSGEGGVTFATVDSVDKLTVRAALYETTAQKTTQKENNKSVWEQENANRTRPLAVPLGFEPHCAMG